MANHEERVKRHARIVARAWQDDKYKKRLLEDPASVLADEGVDIPPGVKIKTVENTPDVMHFVLPAKPKAPMSEEEIAKHRMGPMETCA